MLPSYWMSGFIFLSDWMMKIHAAFLLGDRFNILILLCACTMCYNWMSGLTFCSDWMQRIHAAFLLDERFNILF